MDLTAIAVIVIVVAGVAMGFINNLAGAAGVLGLMAFGFAGLDETQANASLRLSALAIGGLGLVGFWTRGRRVPGKLWLYGALTIPGAVAGAVAVEKLPPWVHQLTLFVLLSLVLIQQCRKRGENAATEAGNPASPLLMIVMFSWLGAHMGYVQVATGLVAIFILSIVHSRDLIEVNAAKMVLVIVSALASNITLACTGSIIWAPAALLAVGAGLGSFLASRWSIRKGHSAVRVVVVVICVAALLWLVLRVLGQ